MEKSPLEGYKNVIPIVTGKPGYAEVYYAERIDMPGLQVVIKMFKELPITSRAQEYNERRQREINNEAYALKKLSQEYIKGVVKYVDNGVCQFNSEKVYFLAQEYLPGGTLFDFIYKAHEQGKKVPHEVSCHIFKELITIVEKIHSKGFAHLDIKAENIMFDAAINVTLIDFGHAKELKGIEGSGLLKGGFGTEGYASPEIMSCVEAVRKGPDNFLPPPKPFFAIPVDVFSLGVVLYALIFQDFPFRWKNPAECEYKAFYDEEYSKFWEQKKLTYKHIDDDLKNLLTGMLVYQPSVRLTIPDILSYPWIKKHLMNEDEAKKYIKEVLFTKPT